MARTIDLLPPGDAFAMIAHPAVCAWRPRIACQSKDTERGYIFCSPHQYFTWRIHRGRPKIL